MAYQATDVPLGFVVTLDLRPTPKSPPPLLAKCFEVGHLQFEGSDEPRTLVFIRVPGRQRSPSHSKPHSRSDRPPMAPVTSTALPRTEGTNVLPRPSEGAAISPHTEGLNGGPPGLVIWATALVAVYGAPLATYNASLTRQRERRDRERHERELARDERRVVVQARHVAVPDHPPLVGVRAVCDGPRPVKLTGFGLLLENGRQLVTMPIPVETSVAKLVGVELDPEPPQEPPERSS